MIHDLLSLRQNIEYKYSQRENSFMSSTEMEIFKLSDAIICHNEQMKDFLVKSGVPDKNIQCLGIFDYIISKDVISEKKNSRVVCVAGNLDAAKSGYIYKMMKDKRCNFKLNLYGPNFSTENVPENFFYKGQIAPDLLPSKIEGAFGLVWDGKSTDSCEGIPGEYLKVNNPHKCSLYIVSGLPVIIWDKAALAPFIIENGIGIAVSSLADVAKKLNAISDEDYNKMCDNVMKVRQRLINGDYFVSAVNKSIAAFKAQK